MIRPQTCPICDTELATNAATQSPLFPFCSRRCKLIDLYRWTEGQYAVVEPLTPEQMREETGVLDPEVFEGETETL